MKKVKETITLEKFKQKVGSSEAGRQLNYSHTAVNKAIEAGNTTVMIGEDGEVAGRILGPKVIMKKGYKAPNLLIKGNSRYIKVDK